MSYRPKVLCECSDPRCRRTIPMSYATYRRVALSGPVLHAWCQIQAVRRNQRERRRPA